MEEGKLMGKAFIALLILLGLSVGGLYWADPVNFTMKIDDSKANLEKMVNDLKKKAE